MRVSCTSFVRFLDKKGRYGLLVNRNRKEQGRTVLSPVGGALEVERAQGDRIMRELGLVPDDFDKKPADAVELRFMVDDRLLKRARDIYKKLDTCPERELTQELVGETGILTPDDLVGHDLRFAWHAEEQRTSHRSGKAMDQMTLRLADVYDLGPQQLVDKLIAASEKSPWLYFVSRAEIEQGRTRNGIEIAPVSELLLPKK